MFMQVIRLFPLLYCCIIAAVLPAQLSMDLAPFDQVSIIGIYEVELIAADKEHIEISSSGIAPEDIKVSQQRRRLKIGTLGLLTKGEVDVHIKLYYRSLESLELAGGVKLKADTTLVADKLYLRAGSGSEAHLSLQVDNLDVRAAEGAILTLEGEANYLRVAANTGGILDGHRLTGRDVTARANTGGEVSVKALEAQDARANTGGIIRLLNEPTKKSNISIGIGGDIEYIKQR